MYPDFLRLIANQLMIAYLICCHRRGADIFLDFSCYQTYSTSIFNRSHQFIEKLATFISDSDSKEFRLIIGEILYDLAQHLAPIYPEELIIRLARYLYESGEEPIKDIADRICDIYARRNIEFLRPVCKENRDF